MPAIGGISNTAPKTPAARHPKSRGRPAGWPSRRTATTSAVAPIASGFASGAWPIRVTHVARRLPDRWRYKTSQIHTPLKTSILRRLAPHHRYKTSCCFNPLCFWDLSRLSPAMSYKTTSPRAPGGSSIAAATSCAWCPGVPNSSTMKTKPILRLDRLRHVPRQFSWID